MGPQLLTLRFCAYDDILRRIYLLNLIVVA